ncbi:hypothetical protein [Myceligenerans crystallogenes]|uniref:pPIWI-RE three-gene island domain-containing protein n=1 Tax=Myceligenerans crystallogenes TaxID=316335 RepID=A0ABP4ZW44_9MICO
MRSTKNWSASITRALRTMTSTHPEPLGAAELAEVELALFLLAEVKEDARAIDVWPLLGGYPYARAFNPRLTPEQDRRVQTARYYLAGLRRRHIWLQRLERYMAVDQQYRGYDLDAMDAAAARRDPSIAPGRFDIYDQALDGLAVAPGEDLPLAGAGQQRFSAGRRDLSVNIPEPLVTDAVPVPMPLRAGKAGQGKPITVSHRDLLNAARAMMAAERANDVPRPRDWVRDLEDVEMSLAAAPSFAGDGFVHAKDWELTVDGLFHLVGMVGAGKSTIMHLLTYHCVVELGLKVTVVVGDVAESLKTVATFNALGSERISAAPIVGRSTRERHILRLHRRQHSAGKASMLEHSSPAFDYLSSACPIDALRGYEGADLLRIHEAPCERLYPAGVVVERDPLAVGSDKNAAASVPASKASRTAHGCPLWTRCPRHRAARDLVDAPVWVATMAGLLHARLPRHQTGERVRYLEAAADRSDLIIIDEADRVQTQLDDAFAPAATLCGSGDDSWIDWLQRHTITRATAEGRKHLTDSQIARWTGSLNVVHNAADRIYTMLNNDKPLRDWVGTKYFSAMTLHQELYQDWIDPDADDDEKRAAKKFFDDVLNAFRDRPVQAVRDRTTDKGALVAELVDLTNLLLSSGDDDAAGRLDDCLARLTGGASRTSREQGRNRRRFAFAMLVAALDNQLTVLISMWPGVEAALNLEAAANALTHRPPRDFEAVMVESPMGNVLGYQFTEEEPGPPAHSGALRFFHCNGVGRDLLRKLPRLGLSEEVPGPHVVLMSGTSWAGTSTRYHLGVPVKAILRPSPEKVAALHESAAYTAFQFSKDEAIRISGTGKNREAAVKEMLKQLATTDPALGPAAKSALELELDELPTERRRILLLTGSYDEARMVANYLNDRPRWSGKVTHLIADDADRDDAWYSLRRGDVAGYASLDSEILVAPLLAVERGHNIVLEDGTAALGSVYFLARPHDRPDNINLAIYAINDWAMRYTAPGGGFGDLPGAHDTLDDAAGAFRNEARKNWYRYLIRRISWSSLSHDEKSAFAWDQMVVMWQVIGRLVRGGVRARVHFCDAAFAPLDAQADGAFDTEHTGLLARFEYILRPYFDPHHTSVSAADRTVAQALFGPFWDALININEKE